MNLTTSAPITGPQVNLLLAKFINLGRRRTTDQLEWLEYDSGLGIRVNRLEEITKFQFSRLLPRLEALEADSR